MLQKKVFYTIILIITAITLAATAATCSMCGIDLTGYGEQEQAQDNKDSSSDEKDDVSSTDKDTKSKDKTADSKIEDNKQKSGDGDSQRSESVRIMDMVIGDVMDQHVEPAANYLTDSIYTCYPVLAQKPDGTETYNWTVSGGTTDDGDYYMQWTTPPDEGWYIVKVDVQRGGASDTFSRDIYVEPDTAMGPPLEGPQITGIEVADEQGNTVNELDLDTQYNIKVLYTDPNRMINQFTWEVDFGWWSTPKDDYVYYRSPDFETQVTINVFARDDQYIVIVQESFTINVVNIQ